MQNSELLANCCRILCEMRSKLFRIGALVAISLCGTNMTRAADPQPYGMDWASTDNGNIDDTLRATSELEALRVAAPVSPFGLIARARGDVDRLRTVLDSFGYYQARVTISIEGRGLNDGGLGDDLTGFPKDRKARVSVKVDLNDLYRLRRIEIDGEVPKSAQEVLALKTGAPAVAANVLEAGNRLLNHLQELGFAFAKVDPPVAYEDKTEPVLDVSFHVETGPRARISDIRIEGLKRLHEKLVRGRIALHKGQPFSPSAIERARRDLLNLGPIGSISVQLATQVDASGEVPVTFQVRERPRHAVTINAAYSSDLGGSGGVSWTDRNVFGNAEQLALSARAINFGGGTATTGVGYDTSAKFTQPDFLRRDQSLQVTLSAIKQSLQAYDQTAHTGSLTLTRKLSSVWAASVSVTASDEQILQDGKSHNYSLIGLPVVLSYDSTHLSSPLDDPLHGARATISVAPTEALGRPNAIFIISQIKAATYLDIGKLLSSSPGRSVLALRGFAGIAQGAGALSLPPDQRFYAGGSETIRGYRYQAVGPTFPDTGYPTGGTAIAAGSAEFRQRYGRNLGAAIFIDGGQASASLKLVPNEIRVGVGAGIRYYTPIGPIRLDFAVPTRRYSKHTDRFEIYIGLGQAF